MRFPVEATPVAPGSIADSFPINNEQPPRFTDPPRSKTSQADRRINFLLNQHFKNDAAYRPLLIELAKLDPTPKKKYLGWLVKHWLAGHRFKGKCKVRENLRLHALASARHWKEQLEGDFLADIFNHTPQTLQKWKAKNRKKLRYQEALDSIERGCLVTWPGAEIAHQDERYTVIRIRTREALGLLSHYGLWCTRYLRYRDRLIRDQFGEKYYFPFDVILAVDGERYLRNFYDLRDQWNIEPSAIVEDEILKLCSIVQDSVDRFEQLIRDRVRMTPELEADLIRHPSLAAEYATKVIRGRWPEFEKKVSLSKLEPGTIFGYCTKNTPFRWERAERFVQRSEFWAERYEQFFNLQWSPEEKKLAG